MSARKSVPVDWMLVSLMVFVAWVCFYTEWFDKRHSFDDFKPSTLFKSLR